MRKLFGSASTTFYPSTQDTSPTHHTRKKNPPIRSLSDPQGSREHEDVGQDDAYQQQRARGSTSTTTDRGPMHTRTRNNPRVRDEETRDQYSAHVTRRSHASAQERSDPFSSPSSAARLKPEDAQFSTIGRGRQAVVATRRGVDKEQPSARREPRQKQNAGDYSAAPGRDYDALKTAYDDLYAQFCSLKGTLEQRTSELHSVHTFLTTADTFSCAEVVNTLQRLNEGVQQRTTYMADWAVDTFKFALQTPPTANQTRTSAVLGPILTQLLAAKRHGENRILVELALRAYLMYELYRITSLWDIGQEERSHSAYIDTVYRRIRDKEGQAISGNWRALMRGCTLPAHDKDPGLAQTSITNTTNTIISGLSDILSAAGCTTSKSNVSSALRSSFAEQIRHFISLAGQVNKMIGVGVISQDLKVLVVSPDMIFDDKAMDDLFDSGDGVQGTRGRGEAVLCPTDLGLMAVGDGRGKTSDSIVLKPKVALVSTVIDIVTD